MDERNQMLQPQDEALSPQADPAVPAQVPEEAPEAPQQTPESQPTVSQETQVFTPVPEPTPKATDATTVFPPVQAPQEPVAPAKLPEVSYFDGDTWQYLGWWALSALLTICTLGVGLAWAQCMFWRYKAKHTVVCNRRLTFDGRALDLFEKYLVWGGLTLVTLGIYGLWVPVKVQKWRASRTYLTGYRRRPSQPKVPVWRAALVATAAVLIFGLLVTGVVMAATHNLPWQQEQPAGPSETDPPPQSTPGPSQPPQSTPEPSTTPPQTDPPESTPAPTDPPDTTPAPTDPPAERYTVTARSGLTLRQSPVNGKAIGLLPDGTQVSVEEWDGNWAKVTYDGKTGWCSGDYLKKNAG